MQEPLEHPLARDILIAELRAMVRHLDAYPHDIDHAHQEADEALVRHLISGGDAELATLLRYLTVREWD